MGRRPTEGGAKTEIIRMQKHVAEALARYGNGDVNAGAVAVLSQYVNSVKKAVASVKPKTLAESWASPPAAPVKKAMYVGKRR